MAGNGDQREETRRPDAGPGPGYEERDVNIWAVGKFGIALVLACIMSVFLLFGLFRYFQAREAAEQPAPEPTVGLNANTLPPEPRLQTAPVLDLKQMRAAEDQILGSYGWVDRRNGIVRIPIDRAIDLLAQRGLPSRPTPGPVSAAAGVSVPTESGLGPKMMPPGGPLSGELGTK